MIKIRTLDHLPLPARVFYRVDYNVPLDGTRITDATRIEETLPTLRRLLAARASVVIASHLGRPKGERKTKYSLAPVREKLAELLGMNVKWANDCVGEEAEQALNPGEVLLLENLRFHAGEEANDRGFAEQLRKLADVYVNDAFGACHRAHSSIDALPRLFDGDRIAGGLLLAKEIEFLQKITNVADRPFVALLGGAKIAGKIEPLEALVKLADTVLVGGGMANTFLAAQGKAVGKSLCEHDLLDTARKILAEAGACEIVLPVDAVAAKEFKAGAPSRVVAVDGVAADEMILDMGPQSVANVSAILKRTKTLVWNGPFGAFELKPFDAGTVAVAREAASRTKAGDLVTIAGGGDTVSALNAAGVADDFTYISTAGGAFLEWLEGKRLPGVEALRKT